MIHEAAAREPEEEVENPYAAAIDEEEEENWEQTARVLCHEYIGHRLYRAGCMTPRLLYSLPLTASSETSQRLRRICQRLEILHPDAFASPLTRQMGLTLASGDTVARAFRKFARRLLIPRDQAPWHGWGRPAALYCMAGAFALDCVRLGHPEHAGCVVECLVNCVRDCPPLTRWLLENGGWHFPDLGTISAAATPQQQQQAVRQVVITYWKMCFSWLRQIWLDAVKLCDTKYLN